MQQKIEKKLDLNWVRMQETFRFDQISTNITSRVQKVIHKRELWKNWKSSHLFLLFLALFSIQTITKRKTNTTFINFQKNYHYTPTYPTLSLCDRTTSIIVTRNSFEINKTFLAIKYGEIFGSAIEPACAGGQLNYTFCHRWLNYYPRVIVLLEESPINFNSISLRRFEVDRIIFTIVKRLIYSVHSSESSRNAYIYWCNRLSA